MINNLFPVGYVKCRQCGRPALWLVENTQYKPNNSHEMDITIKYEMVNYKEVSDKENMLYVCDSCSRVLNEDNFDPDYIIFLDEVEREQ